MLATCKLFCVFAEELASGDANACVPTLFRAPSRPGAHHRGGLQGLPSSRGARGLFSIEHHREELQELPSPAGA